MAPTSNARTLLEGISGTECRTDEIYFIFLSLRLLHNLDIVMVLSEEPLAIQG